MGERWGRFGRLARGSSPGGEGSLTTLSRRRLAGAASREQVIVKLLSLLLTSTYISPISPQVIVKLLSLLLTSTFSVALRASIADTHRDDPAALTGKLGLVSASASPAP